MADTTVDDYDETNEGLQYVLEDPKSVKDEDEWREVNCPRERNRIYFLCLRNQRHFGQSETTEGTDTIHDTGDEKEIQLECVRRHMKLNWY